MRFYECGARYAKTMENGLEKKVTELYSVDALSFAEAEGKLVDELSAYYRDGVEVVTMKIAPYQELVDCEEGDRWYRAKVKFVTVDEKTGREKKACQHYLVRAKDIDHARARLDEFMKGSLVDWECESLVETKIVDVYLYHATKAETYAPGESSTEGE